MGAVIRPSAYVHASMWLRGVRDPWSEVRQWKWLSQHGVVVARWSDRNPSSNWKWSALVGFHLECKCGGCEKRKSVPDRDGMEYSICYFLFVIDRIFSIFSAL